MTDAERSLSSSVAIRASSIACSFLASSYSEFSEMSPNSRASLIRSATSRRFSVERYSISFLRFSRPSGVRMTSFCMTADLPWGLLRRKRPAQGEAGRARTPCGIADGSKRLAHFLERRRVLEQVLEGLRRVGSLDVPGMELP